MRAGKLNKRITLEYRQEQKESDYGGVRSIPKVFASAWASIEPMGGRENWRAMQVNPELTHEVRIRYLPDVTSKMRVKYVDSKTDRTRYFNIVSVLTPEERRQEMRLHCVEEVDG